LWLYFHSAVAGFSLLVFEVSWSHNDAPQSVGLLWTSDQSVAETSIWQNTTLTTNKPSGPRLDSNPQRSYPVLVLIYMQHNFHVFLSSTSINTHAAQFSCVPFQYQY